MTVCLGTSHLLGVVCLFAAAAAAATAEVGGESYLDVIERIRPVIIELERQRRSVLVVCHLAVLRCIHAYFMGTKLEDIPYKSFQRHILYELKPGQRVSEKVKSVYDFVYEVFFFYDTEISLIFFQCFFPLLIRADMLS